MSFELAEVSSLRILDHDSIDDTMEKRRVWREIAQQRWVNGRQNHGVIISRQFHKIITQECVDNLHSLAEVLLNATEDFKLVVSVDQARIYANDPDLFDRIERLQFCRYISYSQAQIDRPRDTVVLKRAGHDMRTYLRHVKMTWEEKDRLVAFFQGQQPMVRLSPGLRSWMDNGFNRCQDYFFIDHTGESWLTLLNLVHPGLVRKTLHIIPAK